VKLYLNSESYPYDDMNLDFNKNRSILYDMYACFCKNYYGYDYLEPNQIVKSFRHNGPFVIIDCSQNKIHRERNCGRAHRIQGEGVRRMYPMNITAYCIIIHDRVVPHNSLTNVVRKII